MARDFARSFYRSKEWLSTREYVLKRDRYLCVKCGRPAEEVHHLIHLSVTNINDAGITLNADNLASLCRSCHFNEHRGEHGNGRKKAEATGMDEYYFDDFGMLQKKTSPP